MLPFLLGTGCMVAPQVAVPIAAGVSVLKAARHAVKARRQPKDAQASNDSSAPKVDTKSELLHYASFEGPSQAVMLQFDDLKCSLWMKKGGVKDILKGVSGVAKAGRCGGSKGRRLREVAAGVRIVRQRSAHADHCTYLRHLFNRPGTGSSR